MKIQPPLVPPSPSFIPPVHPPLKSSLSPEETAHLRYKANVVVDFIRRTFFFHQAKNYLSTSRNKDTTTTPYARFFDPKLPDDNYPLQKKIQKTFNVFDQDIVIGKLKYRVRVLETKNCPVQGAFNHFIAQGTTSNLDNNIHNAYPHLAAYLKAKKTNPSLKGGRFVIATPYSMTFEKTQGAEEVPYLPSNFDEWGLVLKKTLETLTEAYGKFDAVSAHSLSNIPIVALLNHFKDEDFKKLFPKKLLLAHGPSSLKEVSKNVPRGIYPYGWFLGVGLLMYLLAKLFGWTLELDTTLVSQLQRMQKVAKESLKKSHLIITKAHHDSFFPHGSGLANSRKLKDLKGVIAFSRLGFDSHHTVRHRESQHDFTAGDCQRLNLIYEKVYDSEGNKVTCDPQAKKNHPLLLPLKSKLSDMLVN